jgi:hypothetical protein
MTNKKKLALILSPILLLCLLCATPWAYIAYRDNQEYEADVDRLYAIAEKLGHTDETHIRFFREKNIGVDYAGDNITLVFYSTYSFEEFLQEVDQLNFLQRSYSYNRRSIASSFISSFISQNADEKIVTLNGYYLEADFDPLKRPPPIVTNWVLKDTEGRGSRLNIYYAQTPREEDTWLIAGKPISGNVVVIKLDRLSGDE